MCIGTHGFTAHLGSEVMRRPEFHAGGFYQAALAEAVCFFLVLNGSALSPTKNKSC